MTDIGFFRPLLAIVLLALGLLLRFGNLPPSRGFGVTLPWTYADEDIFRRSNRRLGDLVLAWGGWTALQIAVGFPWSWLQSLWAPFFLVTVFSLSYSARLYQLRYHTLRVERAVSDDRPYPRRGGWLVVVLREAIPLAVLLVPILIIRGGYADLPERIPVRWGMLDGASDWRWRDEALTLLRHQTMVVYLVLVMGEGGYLMWTWFRGERGDVATRMLTRTHWMIYGFRLGWIALFAGINLGFVYHARAGSPLFPFLGPGLVVLALLGLLTALEVRRADYRPPAGS